MKKNNKIKVLVALSGGVDSSVSAALLLRQGYDVTGAFMKQWSESQDMAGVCSWKQDRRDALRVAAFLGIPLLTLDFEKEYKQWVTEYMFAEYEAGRTPNPDVLCNKYIKFGVWLDKAKELGFEYLATGHYARNKEQGTRNNKKFLLMTSKDTEKDQTYFLHQLGQQQLAYTLFPVGDYTKKQVRAMAKRWKLPTAERPESMGICFVGEVPMKEFLQQKIKPTPGKIVTTSGEEIGQHDGLAFYTIGQRNFGIRNNELGIREQTSLFVVEKRIATNELVVGHEDDPLLYSKITTVSDVHFVSGQMPVFPLRCEVRLRHRQPLERCRIRNQESGIVVEFKKQQRAVTPGQFAVFYKKGECLGGGVIQ